MISKATIEKAMYEAMKRGATVMPPDVESKLREALAEETVPLAKQHLEISLENARLANAGHGLVCGDTGFPLFFIRAGAETQIEGGFGALWECARKATARCTEEAFLRPTMVDPLSRKNPGDNIGPGMPKVELSFAGEGGRLEIIAAPKGGGSEIFGTFYKMLFPADGKTGIKKFIIESIKNACYAGKICPPAIVGIGIGGTADLCMKLAKEAALLRRVGEPNPDPEIARLEQELLAASRELGIGPMGASGINCVIGMHIETALTHTAALPVAVNAQCLVGRRWKVLIDANNNYQLSGGNLMNMIKHLQLPLSEAEARSLKVGDMVTVSGKVFTGRSRFHIRAIEEDILPPIDFSKINTFFHVGPVMRQAGDGWELVSIEPTSSIRFERYGADVVRKLKLRTLIGKTTMGPATTKALQEVGGVYLTKIGICGNQIGAQVKKIEGVYFLDELGKTEATWVFEVERFGPFFVGIDAHGNNYFEDLSRDIEDNMSEINAELGIPEDYNYTDVNSAVRK